MMQGSIAFDGGEWGLAGAFRLRQVRGQWALIVEGLGVLGLPTLEQVGAVVTVSRAGDGELRVLQAHSVEVIDERGAPVVFARG